MNRLCRAASILGAGILLSGAGLPTVRVLPAALAVEIAQHALAACTSAGYQVAVVIVDPAGVERVLIAGDGVKSIDIESARRKALTASALRVPTADIAAKALAAPAFQQILMNLNPSLLLIGGGLPIMAGGDMVGAIGVGGAPGGDKDQACGQVALTAARAQLR